MPPASSELSIVIVNYRTAEMTIDCLDSLLPELDGIDARIVVVDNASGDDSVPRIRAWIAAREAGQRIDLLEALDNRGFSAGNNMGIARHPARHYLLLNSDTLARPGALRALLDAAAEQPRIGLIGARLEWPDGTPQVSCFRSITPLGELIAAARTGPLTRLLKRFDVPLPIAEERIQADWVSFACVLVRAEVFADIGPMDEGYFMYFEDAAFCREARKRGWRIAYEPAARVVHLRGGSSPVKRRARRCKRLPRYYYASRARYFRTQFGFLGLTSANLLWSAGRVLSRFRELVERRASHVCEQQWRDIWIDWLNTHSSAEERP